MKTDQLVLYRQPADSLFVHFAELLYNLEDDNKTIAVAGFGEKIANSKKSDEDRQEFFECMASLVSFGASHGFRGNLWHCYMTFLMVHDENDYSISCEMTGSNGGSLDRIALRDFEIFKELFDIDLTKAGEVYDYPMDDIIHFEDKAEHGKIYSQRIRDCISELSEELEKAADAKEFMDGVVGFYRHYGVGKFGLHKAFRLNEEGEIVPITKIAHVHLDDLVGCEIQKKQLVDNTEAFVHGKRANNALLFGDAGTGKSTSIKAIVNQYYDEGLRMIEVYKHEFKYLNSIIAAVKNRNYRFIIYMDDLSFEEFEIEYKYLKAVIEGGLEKKPDNVLIYATSNRRHLIHESNADNKEYDDLHKNDTKQEKLSLSKRFGVTIYFGAPTPKEFKAIIIALRDRNNIPMSDEEILAEANKWEISHGGLSGRTAQQFVDHILGGLEEE